MISKREYLSDCSNARFEKGIARTTVTATNFKYGAVSLNDYIFERRK